VTRVRTRSRGAPPLDAWHDPPERLQPIRHLESWPWTWQRDARDPQRGLAPTLQQITDAAKQLFGADGAGLMLVDAEGQLRWASASDQTAQNVEDGQERLAQGPCAVAFSQRLPAAIRNIKLEPDWQEFAQVLVSEGICAALSVPVELDGGVIGTLDIYVGQPRDWDPSEVAALQAYAGLVASLLNAATTAQVKGRLADQLQAALEHRWLIEQAKGVIMGREELDAQAAFERLRSAARSSTRRLADVAKDVTGGQPLPADRQKLARARAGQAKERETAPNGRTDGAGTFVPGQPVRQRPRPAEAAARRAKRQPRFGI
jgi:GAF domain-containing protein